MFEMIYAHLEIFGKLSAPSAASLRGWEENNVADGQLALVCYTQWLRGQNTTRTISQDRFPGPFPSFRL